ncbi:MAG: immunoglobulin-like domain-containing protein, partial [Turicibacter sp.]
MRKVNKKKCSLSLGIMVALVAGVMFVSRPTMANVVTPEDNIGLVIDKLAKDTLKVSLSNVSELLKSVQFSIVIDGDVSFDEKSFVPLVSGSREASSLANVVFSEDKKEATFYLVSNEAIAKDGGNIEVGQLKVKSLDHTPVKYAIKSRVAGDGTAYKYVVSTTNKQVSGPEMTLVDEGAITFNAIPTLTLISSPQVVEGKIVLTVGDEFTEDMQKSFVLAADEEDLTPVDVSVSGVVDVNTVGSYALTYQVTDSLGDKATLIVPVIVENKVTETIENPKITGVKDEVKLVIGDAFNPLDGVLA